ncbi:MAG: hypothetical protein ACRD2N_16595, partial [Vicinamibacterales bacterium]
PKPSQSRWGVERGVNAGRDRIEDPNHGLGVLWQHVPHEHVHGYRGFPNTARRPAAKSRSLTVIPG